MSKLKLLQVGPQSERLNHRLAEVLDISKFWLESDQAGGLVRYGAEIDAVTILARFGCGTQLLKALPNLMTIFSLGVGYDSIDIKYAQQNSILVSNAPGWLSRENGCASGEWF